jgi:hypothetical protein
MSDRYTDRFGFRSFEARDGKFYLNNEPFYMVAALDQDFTRKAFTRRLRKRLCATKC